MIKKAGTMINIFPRLQVHSTDLVSIDYTTLELFELIDPNFKDVSAKSIAQWNML